MMKNISIHGSLKGFSFTLNQANIFHHSMKPQNSELNSYIYIFYYQSNICFYLTPNWASFLDI